MQDTNPYAFAGGVPAIQAAADERALFLKKVYGLLLAGILTFAATIWSAENVAPVKALCDDLWRMITGSSFGWLLYMGILIGGGMLVHAMAERKPINVVLFFAWAVLLGLLIAPIVLYAASAAPQTLTQASLLTAIVFLGLTAVVFFTGKDFSFLRGYLAVGFFGLIGIAIAGIFMGFSMGLWFSALAIVLFAGYIVYDTSNILHHYTTKMAVTGAIVLFTDVVLMFKHILIMLLATRD